MTVTINGTTGIDKVQDGSIQAADLASGVPSRSQLPAGTVFFKAQRGEATQQEWLDKVAEIQARYPYEVK